MKASSTIDFSHFFGNNVTAFITNRNADFTLPKDSLLLTPEQKAFLQKQIGPAAEGVKIFRQVHGNRVVCLEKEKNEPQNNDADGFVTRQKNLPLMVRTADCLSIFLYDPKTKSIGLVHAGWKGTQKNIAARAVLAMKKHFQANPPDIKVVLGPCIQSCCYEVGKEFKDIFPQETFQQGEQFFLDLAQVNLHQLEDSGVDLKNVWDCGLCTSCEASLFSHRREGEKAGRMLSVMMLKNLP